MYSNRIFVTILVLVSLSSVIFAARTTTVKPTTTGKPTTPGKTTKPTVAKNTTSKDSISLRLGEQGAQNATRGGLGGGKIITTRLGANGNPEEQCQCTLFYLCDQENVIEVQAGSGNECPDSSNVCCRIPLESLTTAEPVLPGSGVNPVDPSPIPPETVDPIPTNSQQPPVDNSNTQNQQNCVCVPFYQCIAYDPLVQTAGAGIIDPRFPCNAPDVCCPTGTTGGTGTGGETPQQPPFNPDPTPTQPVQPPYEPVTPSQPPYVPPVGTPNADECGIRRPSVDNRISAPEHLAQTSFGEFPWMALILNTEVAPNGTRTENVFVCGASLLSPSIVLTAAHCVTQIPDVSLLRVRVGEYNTHQGTAEPLIHQDRSVSRITIHNNFNNRVLFNDLALIRVSEEFNLASHISPICTGFINSIYADPNSYNPSQCVATGWGRNAFKDGNYQTTLKRVDLTLIEREECQNRLRRTRLGQYFSLDPSFICAGGQPGFDTCQGDGGGPLVCASRDNPNRYIQVGVVSWGIGCATDVPGVYASLDANRDWLTTEFNTMTVFRRGGSS